MTKRRHVWVLALVAISILGACSDDDNGGTSGNGGAAGAAGEGGTGGGGTGGTGGTGGDPGGTGGTAGDPGGTGGTGGDPGGMCTNVGEDDDTCPDRVGPFPRMPPDTGGVCAPKGECCHRSSNATKVAALGPDEPQVLEYRVTSAAVMNHPRSTSLPTLLMAAAQRAETCAGEQCFLWRFEQPRMGGQPVMGAGVSTASFGRYNCDGTFSYYNDTVAPNREEAGFTDPARWNVANQTSPTVVDPSIDGPGRNKVAWATASNQRLSTSPFFLPGTQTIDWELTTSGFEILEFDTSDAGLDCQGVWDGGGWVTPGRFHSFAPLETNDKDIIDAISQTFCQLLSFSVSAEARTRECSTATDRCVPDGGQYGDGGCDWIKLPDSLCPMTDDARALYRCHLGALGNVNQEEGYPSDAEINCMMEEPTTPLDPDVDPNVSKGQCCDPLGMETNGLPACNAFRIVNQFAAAAAEITDDAKSDFPPVCQ